MKLKSLLFILSLLPTALSAQWVNVGNADYNWGPFLVYSINLATENGEYKENQLPMMLSFKYEKPVEGKNFAISLIKEMEHLKADKAKMDLWLKAMQEILGHADAETTMDIYAEATKELKKSELINFEEFFARHSKEKLIV